MLEDILAFMWEGIERFKEAKEFENIVTEVKWTMKTITSYNDKRQ